MPATRWVMVQAMVPDNYPDIGLPGPQPPWPARPPGGPVDPGYSPPWAQVPPGGQGGGPVDPGYSPPWAQVPPGMWPGPHPSHPIMLPGMPGWGLVPVRPGWPVVPGWPGGSLPGGGAGWPGGPPYPDQGLPGPQPPFPGQPPLVIWGPGDPRPTLPIAGWDPGTGTWPGNPGGPNIPPPITATDPLPLPPPPSTGGVSRVIYEALPTGYPAGWYYLTPVGQTGTQPPTQPAPTGTSPTTAPKK
jgi:hypothetical protein